uniref:Lysozyme c-1 n=1 Tax=Lygus hesperus TaxID=30085 RepID=A0A0A9Y351_LYGHE
MITIGTLLIYIAIKGIGSHKIFTPGELARELKFKNVSSWEIPWLVCMAHQASGLVTGYTQESFNPFHPTEPQYGLFGIPDSLLSESNRCIGFNKTLALDDDPQDDVQCLRQYLNTSQQPRLHALIELSKCLNFWKKLPPYFSLENTTDTWVEYKPTECIDYSGKFTFILSTILILIVLAIIYLSSQIVKPLNKPETLGDVCLTVTKR